MFMKVKFTKIFSNIVFVLLQTAFWMNARNSDTGKATKALCRHTG